MVDCACVVPWANKVVGTGLLRQGLISKRKVVQPVKHYIERIGTVDKKRHMGAISNNQGFVSRKRRTEF